MVLPACSAGAGVCHGALCPTASPGDRLTGASTGEPGCSAFKGHSLGQSQVRCLEVSPASSSVPSSLTPEPIVTCGSAAGTGRWAVGVPAVPPAPAASGLLRTGRGREESEGCGAAPVSEEAVTRAVSHEKPLLRNCPAHTPLVDVCPGFLLY